MRTLRFLITDGFLVQDPSCDFAGLFPGVNDGIQAHFAFSHEWDKRVKVVAFTSILDAEYRPQVLNDENVCLIPAEALARPAFKIQVIGKRNGQIYRTNKLTVYQRGGVK